MPGNLPNIQLRNYSYLPNTHSTDPPKTRNTQIQLKDIDSKIPISWSPFFRSKPKLYCSVKKGRKLKAYLGQIPQDGNFGPFF